MYGCVRGYSAAYWYGCILKDSVDSIKPAYMEGEDTYGICADELSLSSLPDQKVFG